ncbi:MAG: hypothetical protein ACAH59_05295, partial [Pseudobdellovibrionaceae bacterium]
KHRQSLEDVKHLFMSAFRTNLMITLICVAGVSALVGEVGAVIFNSTDPKFAIGLMAVLMWNLLLPWNLGWSLYLGAGEERKSFIVSSWVCTVSKVLLQIAFVPWGIGAVAFSYALSFSLQLIWIFRYLKSAGFSLTELLAQYVKIGWVPFLLALGLGVLGLGSSNSLALLGLKLVAFGILCLLLIFQFVLTEEEKNLFSNRLRKRAS